MLSEDKELIKEPSVTGLALNIFERLKAKKQSSRN